MAQNYTINSYEGNNVGQTDLQNMENNFEVLRSTFSGAAAPANPVSGKQWFDMTKKLPKVRNQANSEWYGVFCGDANQKILVYRNTAMDGYVIEALDSVDRIIGLKSSAGTYATAGVMNLGSWTLPDYTLLEADIPSHVHPNTLSSDGAHSHQDDMKQNVAGGSSSVAVSADGATGGTLTTTTEPNHTHTITPVSYGGSGAHNHGADYRPRAAVVTIQYLDI